MLNLDHLALPYGLNSYFLCTRMHLRHSVVLNPIILIFQHVEVDESYPDILTAHGFTKEFLMSSVREIEAGNATVWSLSGRIPTIGFYRALHVYLKQHFKATKTAIGKLYCGNLKEKEVDLTTLIDLLRELFHLSVILKN